MRGLTAEEREALERAAGLRPRLVEPLSALPAAVTAVLARGLIEWRAVNIATHPSVTHRTYLIPLGELALRIDAQVRAMEGA